MKVTTLLGSANKKGNTATALGWVEAELASMGHEVERITLNNKSIHGCLGCAKCRENPDDIDCIQNDDAQDIMERMILSDGVLFASPIYFWGFTAQTKLLIDRCFSLVTNYRQPGHTSLMSGKRVALLVTGGDAFEQNAEGMFTAFERFSDFLLAKKQGGLYLGNSTFLKSVLLFTHPKYAVFGWLRISKVHDPTKLIVLALNQLSALFVQYPEYRIGLV